MSIGVKICKYVDVGKKYPKISILVKIFANIFFGWKLSKNLNFGQICRKISILVKIVENSRFWSQTRKLSILVII